MRTLIIITLIMTTFLGQKSPKLETGWYYISELETKFLRSLDKSEETYYIKPEKIVGIENFQEFMRIGYLTINDKQIPELIMQLDSLGSKMWYRATSKATNKKLAFVLNDKLIYAPTVYPISGGQVAIWREEFDREDIEAIMEEIKSEMRLINEK